MKYCYVFVRLLLVASIPWISTSACSHEDRVQTTAGEVNVESLTSEESGRLKLEGEWEFYWNQLLGPNTDFQSTEDQAQHVTVPAFWTDHAGNTNPFGFATYRLVITGLSGDDLGLHVQEQTSSYRLFANGKLIAENGEAGRTAEETTPQYRPLTVQLPPVDGRLELIMQISNFDYRTGGFTGMIELDSYELLATERRRARLLDAFVLGVVGIMGIYHLFLHVSLRRYPWILTFAVICGLTVIRGLTTNERILIYEFPDLPFGVLYRLECLSYVTLPSAFLVFLRQLYPAEMHRLLVQGTLVVAGVMAAIVLLTPATIFTHLLPAQAVVIGAAGIYALAMLIRARLHGRRGATLFLVGCLLILAIAVNDQLHSLELIQTGTYSPWGIAAFFLIQATVLARIYGRAFRHAEELSRILEKRVEDRTQDLDAASRESAELAAFSRQLNEAAEQKEIIDEIFRYLCDRFPIRDLVLQMVDKEQNALVSVQWTLDRTEEELDFVRDLIVPLNPESGTLYRTYKRQKPFFAPRILGFPAEIDRAIVETLDLKALAQVPLIVKSQTVGIIWASFFQENPPRYMLDSVVRFCNQVAGAIHSVRLLEEARLLRDEAEESARDVRELADTSRRLNESADLDQTIQDIFHYVHKRFDVPDIVLQLVDEDSNELYTANYLTSADLDESQKDFVRNLRVPLKPESGTLYKTYRRQKTLYMHAGMLSRAKIPASSLDYEIQQKLKFPSFAQFPLVVQKKTVGILWCAFGETRRSQREIESIARFCAQVAGAIRASSLLKEASDATRSALEAREETEVLADLARKANEARNLDGVLVSVAELLGQRYSANKMLLMLADKNRKLFKTQSYLLDGQLGELSELPEILQTFPMSSEAGTVFRTFRRKRTMHMPKIDERWIQLSSARIDLAIFDYMDGNWFALVPLIVEDEAIGILGFSGPGERRLTKADLQFCERMSTQVSGAVRALNLLSETQKAREETEILANLARKANEARSLDGILTSVAELTGQRYDANQLFLVLADRDRKMFKTESYLLGGRPGELSALPEVLRTFPMNRDTGTIFRTFERARTLHIPKIDEGWIQQSASPIDAAFIDFWSANWFVYLPLMVEDEAIGLLGFSGSGNQRLNKSELQFCERMSTQVSGAVRALDLLSETRKAREETQVLAVLAREANEARNLDAILKSVADIIGDRYDANQLFLLLADQGNSQFRTEAYLLDGQPGNRADLPEAIQEFPMKPEVGVVYKTWSRKRSMHIPRITEDWIKNRISEIDRTFIEFWDARWFVYVPLLVENEAIGLLGFSGPEQRRLPQEEILFCERIGAQVSGAVRALDLLERTREAQADAEAARRTTATMADFSRRLNEAAGEDLESVVRPLFKYLIENFDLEGIVVSLVDEAAQELRTEFFHAGDAWPQDVLDYARDFSVPLDERGGTLVRTLTRGRPLYLPRLLGDGSSRNEADRKLIEAFDLSNMVHIPVVVGGKSIGVIWSSNRTRPLDLSRDDIRRMQDFVDQIATAIQNARLLEQVKSSQAEAIEAQEQSERLLQRILPGPVAEELKTYGKVEPLYYENVTVLFTDFAGFTAASEDMMPDELVEELDGCFTQFDEVVRRNGLEKLKTIGDAYMCAAGLPKLAGTHAIDACLTALEFRAFMSQMGSVKESLGLKYWQIRIGLHSGPVTAGVIGNDKFAYDIWGDTVNTASRMESSGGIGEVNISAATQALVADFFDTESRGEIEAKGKGKLEMFFLRRIKPDLSADSDGLVPNEEFHRKREEIDPTAIHPSRTPKAEPTLQNLQMKREGW